jgi:outer membrane cobalamin receptor
MVSEWKLAVGGEVLREDGRNAGKLNFGFFSAPNSFDLSRDTVSGFVEADRSAGALSLNAGLRVDDVEGLSARVTGRAGARYDLGSGLSLKAAAATGFKAPSFYALANPFVGNRNLKPETSSSGELGLAWAGAPGDSASVTLFYSRYKDLIDFIPGPPPRLENRDLVVSKGVSASLAHALSETVTGSVQVQYAQTEDDATGDQLFNRPRWRVNAAVTWTPNDDVSLTVRHAYVGERDDFATPVGMETMAGYNAVSIEAAWTFLPATTARIVIDNALDDDHEDALGFTAPGLGARLYLNRTF